MGGADLLHSFYFYDSICMSMKKGLVLVFTILLFFSCEEKPEVKEEVKNIPVDVNLVRFDQLFFRSDEKSIKELRKHYFYLLSPTMSDAQLVQSVKTPLYKELYEEVQKQFSDGADLQTELKLLYQHLKFYFPKFKTPQKTITVISEINYETKSFLTDTLAVISLDMYLGKDHRFYEFPEYLKLRFEKDQIVQDLVDDYYLRIKKRLADKSFVSQMVEAGKAIYLKEKLIPLSSDAEKMGYTDAQIEWCEANEEYIWRYFVERKLLYDTDKELARRFIDVAPFSKFYLELDNESPGRVGVWLGWKIVQSFMEANDVSLETMLKMDEKELFLQSKYKPKR